MDFGQLPLWAKVSDFIIIGVSAGLLLLVSANWVGFARANPGPDKSDDARRNAGREAINSQLTLSLTAASILLAVSFVVVQLGSGNTATVSGAAVTQVLLAALAFAVSVAITIWNATLIVYRSRVRDVSLSPFTNIFVAVGLFSLMAGAGFFTVGLFLI